MRIGYVAQRLVRLVTLAVLVASGAYVVIYLYRWEWNRALISGLLFVAAELGWLGASLLGRLAAIERRLDDVDRAPAIDFVAPPTRSGDSSSGSVPILPWLDPTRLNVFIPVLMGAGALLSAVAFLVERLARAADAVSGGRRVAGVLGPLALPGTSPVVVASRTRHRGARVITWLIAAAVIALIAAGGVNILASYTKSDTERGLRSGRTEIVLEIGYHDGDRRPPVDTARALLEVCRSQLPTPPSVTEPVVTESRRVRTVIEPALGRLRVRRLTGCLEDATIDRVKAHVVSAVTILDEGVRAATSA